tara:strand:- start:51 stop:302 length:252 start_codon:yes stop_codon:yes gene_type:complete
MALTEEQLINYEITGEFKTVFVVTQTIIKKDGVMMGVPQTHRRPIDSNADISGETQEIQDVCTAVWTPEVKQAYLDFRSKPKE